MFYLTCRAITITSGFLYPVYASFKAIKGNDTKQLETWLMYWAVMGSVSIGETFEWFPFYYEVKTIFLLWLVIPQIQGSSYIYLTYLHPFLTSREDDIDQMISKARTSAKAAGSEWLKLLWQKMKEVALSDDNVATLTTDGPAPTPPGTKPGQPTTFDFLARSPSSYMPTILGGAYAVLRPMQTRSAPTPISFQRQHPEQLVPVVSVPVSTIPTSTSSANQFTTARSTSSSEIRLRRSELENELNNLPSAPTTDIPSNRSFGNLAQSEYDLVRKDEAPAQVTGLWSKDSPAHETQATPMRQGWFWNRSPSSGAINTRKEGKAD